MTQVLSIIESSMFPNCEALLQQLSYTETRVNSMRKAISKIKSTQFGYVLCEFSYGYGNDYAGVTVSNLDVMLYSLQKYSPDSKVVVVVDKSEKKYIEKLTALFSIHAILIYPYASLNDLKEALS